MAGIFDEFTNTFGDHNNEEANASSQNFQEMNDEDIDDELREAEKRLAKAAYYKVVASQGVVDDNGSREASEVNAEAKLWARQSMVKLLRGEDPMAPPKPVTTFTESEVDELKQLAASSSPLKALVAKAIAMGMVSTPIAEPSVRKVSAPVTKEPTVRKVQTQPAPKQYQPKQVQTPVKKRPLRPRKDENGEIDLEAIPSGEVFKDVDGQLYKLVDNPNFNPDNPKSKPRTKIKVTTQVKTPGSIPMPSVSQMPGITSAQSMDTVNAGISASANSPFGSDPVSASAMVVAAAKSMSEG
jgi:hypothetical protein